MVEKIKIFGICGSPIKGGNTEILLKEALKGAEEIGNVETDYVSVADHPVKDCTHCNWCVVKQSEGKYCSITDDGMKYIYPKVLEADGILIATPVYISRMSGYLANVIDRMRALAHGCYYHMALKRKPAGALAVVWYRNSGAETACLSIIGGFLTYEMIPVGVGLAGMWGAVGLSSIHGTGEFDPNDKHQVLKDHYGLRAARTLGKDVATLARIIKVGQQQIGIKIEYGKRKKEHELSHP